MAQIKLQTTSLSSIQRQIEKMQSETENAQQRVISAINGLDFEVSSKYNIRNSMNKINNSLRRQNDLASQYKNAFVNATNRIIESDSKFENESRGIFDKVKDYVKDVIGSVKDFFVRNKIFKYATVAGLFLTGTSIMGTAPLVALVAFFASFKWDIATPVSANNGNTHGGSGVSIDSTSSASTNTSTAQTTQETTNTVINEQPAVNVPTSEEETATLRSELEDRYQRLYSKRGKSFRGNCGAFVYQQLKDMGITADGDGVGAGKDYYSTWTSRGVTRTGYSVETHGGTGGLDALINVHPGETIKNVAVSFQGDSWSSQYGHVMLISEIRDGKVYFMESYGQTINGTYYKEGAFVELSIEDFKKAYKVDSTANGVTYFHK